MTTLKLNPVSICQETRGPATPSRCRSDSMQGILARKSICISRCQSRARGIPSPLACSASVLLERGSVPKFGSGLGKASKFYFHKSSFDRRSPPLIQNVFLSLPLCRCKSDCRVSLGACNQT